MKKILITFLLLGSLMLASCSGNSPKAVAEKFLKAINAGDFKEAKKYCDEKTGDLIGMLESFSKGEKPKEKDIKSFTITKVEENGDTAKVFYKAEGSDKEESLDLKKIKGKWLVSINKEQGKENGMHHEDGDDHSSDDMEIDTPEHENEASQDSIPSTEEDK